MYVFFFASFPIVLLPEQATKVKNKKILFFFVYYPTGEKHKINFLNSRHVFFMVMVAFDNAVSEADDAAGVFSNIFFVGY